MYVYRTMYLDDDVVFLVGFFDPEGNWHDDRQYKTKYQAAERVHYLNGNEDNEEQMPDERQITTKEELLNRGIVKIIPHDHGSAIYILFEDNKYIILSFDGFYDRESPTCFNEIKIMDEVPYGEYLRYFFDHEKPW